MATAEIILIAFNSLLCFFTILVVLSQGESKRDFYTDVFSQLNQINMNQQELLAALSGIGQKFRKGIDEVKAAIANSGVVSPEIEEAVVKLSAAADELDGVTPDPEPQA